MISGKSVFSGAICGLCLALLSCSSASRDRPNFIVVFVDDLGWGDLGSYGHPSIRTPHLDRMAAEGQRWTSFYVASSVCSPSRGALLTGKLPVRTGLYGDVNRVLFPNDVGGGIPEGELTIAELLRDEGYATAMVGKWHLGHQDGHWPTDHGFETWLGIPYSNDMDWTIEPERSARIAGYYAPQVEYWNVPLIEADGDGARELERPAQQPTITRRYTEAAVEFVRENRRGPFFLYLAHTQPHLPLFRDPAFEGHSAAGEYGDVIEELDWSVGQLLETVEELGIAEETVVVFTSDNGPWNVFAEIGGLAGPLRMGKGTTFEGGMRVPGIFWGPGLIAPGRVDGLGSTLDFFATFAAMVGAEIREGAGTDSVDLSPVFGGAESPRTELAFYRGSKLFAYRSGDYKAHFLTQGAYGEGPELTAHDPPLLYHLGVDPGERTDIAEREPERARELLVEAVTFDASIDKEDSLFDAARAARVAAD